jgi:hypothetical protein
MDKFNIMSKIKNAELEERALNVADKLLTKIEDEISFSNPKDLKILAEIYQILKPYL